MPRLFSSSLGLCLCLVLVGCHRVPATVDIQDAPAPAPGVFVETETKTKPAADGRRDPISADYVALYACWFERPYEYMFEYQGQPLELEHGSFGMFMAGIHGLLYYGHLNDCAGRLTGQSPRNYADIAPLEALAGVPATLPNANLPFAAVNPDFVHWARTDLLPPGDQLILGLPAQLAYERVFSRFFRAMATGAAWLAEGHLVASEAQTYLHDVKAGADGLDWIEQRYTGVPINGYADGTTMSGPMAVGFWLRRELDGSLASCWYALLDVLSRYDQAWLDQLEAQYPAGVSALGAQLDPLPAAKERR